MQETNIFLEQNLIHQSHFSGKSLVPPKIILSSYAHDTHSIMPKHVTQRQSRNCKGQHSSLQRNDAVVMSCWQQCVRFDRFKI